VEVTEATTCETVIVFVRVAVEVRVVVELPVEDCAAAKRGRRRREVTVGRRIVLEYVGGPI